MKSDYKTKNQMKTISLLSVLAAGVAFLGNQANAGIDINSVGTGGVGDNGLIRFTGSTDSFQFINAASTPTFSFVANGSISGAAGLGSISGTYTIGAVTVSGPLQTAPVSGSGVLTIDDNGSAIGGNLLTANVGWIDIFTFGTAGGLNAGGSVNLTSIAYSGANADLLALKNGFNNTGVATIQFGFVPAKTLNDLKADTAPGGGANVNDSTFTGDLSAAVPEGGSTLLLLGGGLLGLLAFRRRLAVR